MKCLLTFRNPKGSEIQCMIVLDVGYGYGSTYRNIDSVVVIELVDRECHVLHWLL